MSVLPNMVIFNKMEFLGVGKSTCPNHNDGLEELYKLTSSLSTMTVGLSYRCNKWMFTDIINSPNYPNNINMDLVAILNRDMIQRVSVAKATHYFIVFKNLNLVKNKLHPDVLPIIVNFVHSLRQIHYLESKI